MTTQTHHHRSTKRTQGEFNTGHRVAGLIILAVVATFGTLEWMHSHPNVASAESTPQASKEGDMPLAVEYFPGKYVNQATQSEKHIESF